MKSIMSFNPGKRFPAISITGSDCRLNCPHCSGRPLASMLCADTPDRLLAIASHLEDSGALGFLLSGGCDSTGALPVGPFLRAITAIKTSTNLKINAHVGYPRAEEAKGLVSSGIDAFSLNFPINDDVGLRIMRIPNAVQRYFETRDSLEREGASRIVPHVLIGLAHIDEEIDGLRVLQQDPPDGLVVIVFNPLPKTPMRAAPPPDEVHVVEFLSRCKEILPETTIVLGCMRKRGNHRFEKYLIEQLLDGIVMPCKRATEECQGSVKFEEREGCCALYL